MNKIKLAAVFGGASSEHSVSLVSAASVIANLDIQKYDIYKVGITRSGQWLLTDASPAAIEDGSWEKLYNTPAAIIPSKDGALALFGKSGIAYIDIDVIFPILHGINGEDGTIQGLAEIAGVNYVGCGVSASANCMDKSITKKLCAFADIPQGKWISFDYRELSGESVLAERLEKELGYPIFIKPSSTGSSVGISKAHNMEELLRSVNTASEYSDIIIAEQFISGSEIEVAVMGNREPVASVCGEIRPERDFYDYEAKYHDDNSKLFIPAELSDEVSEKVRKTAVEAYKALGCEGMARVDFFVDGDSIYLNEINTIPGFTSISMFPKLFGHSGIPYSDLLDRLISLAADRRR